MTQNDSIPARLAALKRTPTPELKKQWRELFETEPPAFNRVYLVSNLVKAAAGGSAKVESKPTVMPSNQTGVAVNRTPIRRRRPT